jgi:hypothetical protein
MMQKAKAVIVARLEGRCSHCDGIVSPGDRIEKTTGGWMHEDCPADPPDDTCLRWDRDLDG